MNLRYTRWLIPILAIVLFAAWVVWPANPGIHLDNPSLKLKFDQDISVHQGLDLQGGLQVLLEADLPADQAITADQLDTARTIIENRVNGLGVSEPLVQVQGDRRIVVELPGVEDPEQAVATLRQTGLLEFVDAGYAPPPIGTKVQTDFGQATTGTSPTAEASPTDPSATEVPTVEATPATDATAEVTSAVEATPEGQATPPAEPTAEGPSYHTVMTGAALKTAMVQPDGVGGYRIDFTLSDEGAKVFGEYTASHVNQTLAIVLDKTVISAPTVQDPILDGKGQISGGFTQESANVLVVQLRYGSLPIPLKVVQSQTVGPTLGQDSVRKSIVAGSIGLSAVILFMVLYYRLPGLIAAGALAVYALVTFALFKLIPVTLTLPGIAGFILSVGVAVDANILIFERLKEELRGGRTLWQAVETGFSRAWPSIRDSNISTLITCAILYWFGNTFGASIVKGFALTLAIGVGVSLFTALTVTRTVMHLMLDRIDFSQRHAWFGI